MAVSPIPSEGDAAQIKGVLQLPLSSCATLPVALALGQAIAVDDATLAYLFSNRGNYHTFAGRRPRRPARSGFRR